LPALSHDHVYHLIFKTHYICYRCKRGLTVCDSYVPSQGVAFRFATWLIRSISSKQHSGPLMTRHIDN